MIWEVLLRLGFTVERGTLGGELGYNLPNHVLDQRQAGEKPEYLHRKWVTTRFFYWKRTMTHPLIPQIIDLAKPVAEKLGLQVVGAIFQTNQSPPVLRVDIGNPDTDTSLDDCEKMSRALEMTLDATDLIPDAYVLEISSPGISRQLTTDRDFISFKGFGVLISLSEAYKGSKEWQGNLVGRDEASISLNQKGRVISIPRSLVILVELIEAT